MLRHNGFRHPVFQFQYFYGDKIMKINSIESPFKQDMTEDMKSHICDDLCRFANDFDITQDELDEHCENCIVDQIRKIEMRQRDE